jgi:glutamate/tyrosine decarboxylase-like PLP-dependent enzyme
MPVAEDPGGSEVLLHQTTERALAYLRSLGQRSVFPTRTAIDDLDKLPTDLPDGPTPGEKVIELLDRWGSPATVASNGGRYFGFVVGSALPAALAANWLACAWNQNAALSALSPAGTRLESTSLGWIRHVLGLPSGTEGAFVSGATMANFAGLAAARHSTLERLGWNVERDGLFGAPPISVIVGEEVHAAVRKALSLLGLGRDRVLRVPTDAEGRMRPESLPQVTGPAILCTQAGNVNSGAFDPFLELIDWARQREVWVHVDGAFGLWAAASPHYRHLVAGVGGADSWATDGHKWLNVPYDSGLVFVREPRHLVAAMEGPSATYLDVGRARDRFSYSPEQSRRARGVDTWAALMSLGRSGVADLVERCCRYASQFASILTDAGFTVLNGVVLNQVLVSFGSDSFTGRVIRAIQAEGTCWCGETSWKGRVAMRISVSSSKTTGEDVVRSAAAMIRCANAEVAHPDH